MSSERPCFYFRSKDGRVKGCTKPAKYRVILGNGYFIDVCEEHVVNFRGLGYKIIELKEVPA